MADRRELAKSGGERTRLASSLEKQPSRLATPTPVCSSAVRWRETGSMLEPDQLEARRRALLKLREELTELVESATDGAKPVDLGEPIGRISRVDAMQQQKILAANRLAAQQRRRQVDAALSRIDAGEYGECVGCGEEIDPRRVEAQPEAPMCIQCQSQRERRG